MAHKLQIVDVKTIYSQAESKDVLDVAVEVFDGKKSLGIRKFGYPLNTSEEVILADLEKMRNTLDSDKAVGIASQEVEDGMKNAENLKSNLTGMEI